MCVCFLEVPVLLKKCNTNRIEIFIVPTLIPTIIIVLSIHSSIVSVRMHFMFNMQVANLIHILTIESLLVVF